MLEKYDLLWRINSSSTLTNKHFYTWGLPTPRLGNSLYKEFSARVPQSQGGEARQGYINFKLVFPPMNGSQVYTLRSIVVAAGTGLLYLTIDRANGQGTGFDFVDISGYPVLPNFDYTAGTAGQVFSGVELSLNNCTIINAPSNVAGL